VRDSTPSTMLSLKFQFFALSAKLVERGINPKAKDVLYNYIDANSMTKSQTGRAFRVAKEFHVIILQAFIDVCSPPISIVVDLNCNTCIFFHPFLIFLDSKLFLQPFVSLTFAFDCSYKE
jgi:hypothetical protein